MNTPIPRRALLVAALASLLQAVPPFGVALADELPVFDLPPSASELAELLFPARTRSIVIQDDTTASLGSDGAGDGAIAAAPDGEPVDGFGLLINFEFGKASVLPESMAALDTVGEMLNLPQARGQSVVIEGHTDAVGGDAYNQTLSEMRALAVRRYLVSVHGIDQRRLHPVGRGETVLHDARDPRAAINRRVEFRRLDRQDG